MPFRLEWRGEGFITATETPEHCFALPARWILTATGLRHSSTLATGRQRVLYKREDVATGIPDLCQSEVSCHQLWNTLCRLRRLSIHHLLLWSASRRRLCQPGSARQHRLSTPRKLQQLLCCGFPRTSSDSCHRTSTRW